LRQRIGQFFETKTVSDLAALSFEFRSKCMSFRRWRASFGSPVESGSFHRSQQRSAARRIVGSVTGRSSLMSIPAIVS